MNNHFQVEPLLAIYLFCWISAVLVSCYFVLRGKEKYEFLDRAYWQFLFQPWKIITFLVAASAVTAAAPYSGDPTWDIPDSVIISISVYILAPWSVAAIYRSIKYKEVTSKLFVAGSAFFIPCWIYDLYILLRDRFYPPTWYSNIYLSGAIILLAGLFWNLSWAEKTGVTFAFMGPEWPVRDRAPFRKVFWIGMLLGIPVAAAIGWFVITYFFE